MLALLSIAATAGATAVGFLQARSFVRGKLRFVDSVHSFVAPLLAGLGAALIAMPIVWLLPLVGTGTAILFGIAVAAGVSSGARDIRKRIGPGSV